jgi:hypothetical protein
MLEEVGGSGAITDLIFRPPLDGYIPVLARAKNALSSLLPLISRALV